MRTLSHQQPARRQKVSRPTPVHPASASGDWAMREPPQHHGACACGGGCPKCRPHAAHAAARAVASADGLPESLKISTEHLSGLALDDVVVRYHSPRPAETHALALAQGREIHIGPGQERHLAHEAWHVVQQGQGRVAPSPHAKTPGLNADRGLEREADVMGARAERLARSIAASWTAAPSRSTSPVVPHVSPPLTRQTRAGGAAVMQAKAPEDAAELPIDPAARKKIEDLSRRKGDRKPMRVQAVIDLFLQAGVKITKQEAFNWKEYGKIRPWDGPSGPGGDVASNFEPVRNYKVLDDWNAQMAALDPSVQAIATDEVTTSGDGFQFGGAATAAGGAKGAAPKRDPLQEKAFAAIHAYDSVDRTQINVNALFSEKQKDIDHVNALKARGGWVENDGRNDVPLGATYVLANVWEDGRGKTIRQFVGAGIIVDKTATTVTAGSRDEPVQTLTTMSTESLNARTETALRAVKFTSRVVGKVPPVGKKPQLQILGWFIPEQLPKLGEVSGQSPADLRDAYDQTNQVTRQVLDEKAEAEEARRFAMSGNAWMGADWHGAETYGYRLDSVDDLDEQGQPRYVMNGNVIARDKQGNPIVKKKQVRVRIDKPVAKDGARRQALAYKIYAGNPDLVRNPSPGKTGSYFTTCVETANRILSEYGVDSSIFGGLLAPVYQDPKQSSKPRDAQVFKYLKETGGWVWGEEGFVPRQGDVFLTGSYSEAINVKAKSYGLWSFQHVGVVANITANADGTYTVLSQDGGKGMAAIGEDKTGYTIRNYDPKTRMMSGAKPKMVIGVWRPVLIKEALKQLPKEIKATLTPGQLAAYQKLYGK